MKLIIFLVTCSLYTILIIDSKKYKIVVQDELLSYDIDKSVTEDYKTYFNLDNAVFEHIDDDTVQVGGEILLTKSLDPYLPLQLYTRTKYLDRSSWVEGPIRLTLPDLCPELLNPTRFWYNISKFWKACPPQKGDVWKIESQIVDVAFEMPASIPITQWKFYNLYTQGIPGFEKFKFGVAVQVEFIL